MITTSTGFTCEVDEEALNDYELFENLIALESGDNNAMLAVPKVLALLLGDQKQNLLDHCRNEKGRVPIEKVSAEIAEIFASLSDAKKK